MASSSSTNSDLKLVPETILKKRHNLDELKAKRAANELQKGNRRVFSSSSKKLYVKKPETFLAQAKTRKHLDIRYKRVSKKGMQKRASNKKQMSTKVVENDGEEMSTTLLTYQSNSVGANMVFCIRIHDNVGMSGRIKKVLYKLRLKQQYTGVFVQYTDENRKLLQLVEPWVLYGTPSKSMVEDLIRKRGYTRSAVDGKRMALSDNTIIEQALGTKTGIICVEDLVEELYQTGDYFTKANSFLWPFSLRAPKSRFEITKLNEKQGKEHGDKGQEIDEYIKTML
jgi:60S ribosomal protein uL30